ncbi:hypothetical protein [Azotobacter salinestris]|uniref:hypothetical protein n=1 Tax=Azotobacter salinestris TaxID=69964 RepID=UPI0032DE9FA4
MTTPKRTAMLRLDLKNHCEYCNTPRNKGTHAKCSRRRQQNRRLAEGRQADA